MGAEFCHDPFNACEDTALDAHWFSNRDFRMGAQQASAGQTLPDSRDLGGVYSITGSIAKQSQNSRKADDSYPRLRRDADKDVSTKKRAFQADYTIRPSRRLSVQRQIMFQRANG
jgi:hypothetical protein